MSLVCVLGSINMDVVLKVKSFPQPGQTMIAASLSRSAGGKGANQAVAASRAGAEVALAGAVGDDEEGRSLLALLKAEAIDCSAVKVGPDCSTGTAFIMVDEAGENEIVVASGANGRARPPRAPAGRVLLTQLETPLDAVESFLGNRSPETIAILNAAPYRSDAAPLLAKADVLVVNETELAGYCSGSAPRSAADARSMARSLLRDGQVIVVTRGAEGSVTVGGGSEMANPGVKADVLDTTGAGDCFCGYLAAGLAQGAALEQALARAHRAAAISVGRAGAIPSIPHAREVPGGQPGE